MDSSQDYAKYENRIVPEDRDKLISLLEEYSAKLRRKCDYIDKNLRVLKAFLFFLSFISIITCLIAISHSHRIGSDTSFIILMVSGLICFTSLSFLLSLSNNDDSILRKKNIIDSRNHEAHALAHRLNKLVGIASEFYEHVENKAISKIELDLKISEAESVLNYYDLIVGKPKNNAVLWQPNDIGAVNLSLDISKANLALDIRASNSSLRWRTLIIGLQLITLIVLDISMLFVSLILADMLNTSGFDLNIGRSMLPVLAVNLGILTVSGFYGADDKLNRFAKLFKSLTVSQIVLLTMAYFYKPKLWALHSVILTAWPLNLIFIGGARFLFYLLMIQIHKRIPPFQQSIVPGQTHQVSEKKNC
jgi:hypothetical protein